jgi:hypothetical protein
LKVAEKARNGVAEAELQRHHNHSTKDRVALRAVNGDIAKSALRAIKSTEVRGKGLGYDMIMDDLSTLVVGASAIVEP